MVRINENYKKLQGAYLFAEIAKRTADFQKKNPNIEILRLGIGDTTEALAPSVIKGLSEGVKKLSKKKTYTGYGITEGSIELRNALRDHYSKAGIDLSVEEIFISDGAKSDSANIQSIFAPDAAVALADPVYTVYSDSNVIAGRTGEFRGGRYEGLVYLECNEQNGFVPEPPKEHADIIYLCSPNNPTGAVATKEQLGAFVDYALKNKSIIIFDACYAEYISDPALPKSIYEIEGAKKCAIEINSFSKWAGFTGVRLGWTVVPKSLITEDAEAGEVNAVWKRRQNTMFNGASNIAQRGALAALSEKGLRENKKLVSYYMQNAALIKRSLTDMGFRIFGGDHAPYLWLKIPSGLTSWEFFNILLEDAHVVGTPGSGFGRSGEGYLRLSAFGDRKTILKAIKSIKDNIKINI